MLASMVTPEKAQFVPLRLIVIKFVGRMIINITDIHPPKTGKSLSLQGVALRPLVNK